MKDIDLVALGELAKEKTQESRASLLSQVVDLRMHRKEKLHDREKQIMDEILLDLAQQAEIELRAELATQLAHLPNPPETLVDFLINDECEVARPLLVESNAVSDHDLITVIRTQSEGHRVAVAEREELNIEVTGALIEVGEEVVLSTLAANDSADIDPIGMQAMVYKSKTMESLRRPLLERHDLDPVFANQMFWWVSGPLREKILREYPIDEATLDDAMRLAVETGARKAQFDDDFKKPAEMIKKANALRVDELIGKVRGNDLKGLVNQLILELGVSREVVRDALTDKGGHALALLCKSIGASRDQFTTLFLLIDYQRNKKPRPAGDLKEIAMIFDVVSEEQAINTLCFWEVENLLVA